MMTAEEVLKEEVSLFLRKEEPKIKSYFFKKLPLEEVEDKFQDLTVSLLEYSAKIRSQESIPALSRVFAKRIVARHYKGIDQRMKSNSQIVDVGDANGVEDESGKPDEVVTKMELLAFVRKYLNPKLAKIFLLKYYEGWTTREIACHLRLSTGTIKRRLSYAHSKLSAVVKKLGLKSYMFL